MSEPVLTLHQVNIQNKYSHSEHVMSHRANYKPNKWSEIKGCERVSKIERKDFANHLLFFIVKQFVFRCKVEP